MIADLKPYPEYKESGLPWLSAIPAHWQISAIGAATTLVQTGPFGSQLHSHEYISSGIPVINPSHMVGGRLKPSLAVTIHAEKAKELSRHMLCAGDIVIARRGDLGRCALVTVAEEGWICGTGSLLIRCKASAVTTNFFQIVFSSSGIADMLSQSSIGATMANLNAGTVARQRMPLPPLVEQAAIARFLDWANGRLERAIRAKRKVIALLNEQKQAIIHRAVTRGLDPSVPLKPSGIPWLGAIPQHWDTPLFGRLLTRVEQGWSPVAAEGELALDQWAVLTLSAVRRGVFNRDAIKPVSLTANIPTGIEVRDGDVLLTRSNTRDRVGDVCIVRTPRPRTILCDLIYRLQVHAGAIVPEFLVYQLLSRVGRGQIERDARGSSGTMPKISQGHIKAWRILLPPIDEQQRIVECIDAESAPVNAAISRLEREIALLREYRTRLVADVVTGKLDVREAAARLPDEAPPDTAEDDTDLSMDTEAPDEEDVA